MIEEAAELDRHERRPLAMLYGGGVLVVIVLMTAMLLVAINLRERSLEASERNLSNISVALSEQADRAVQGLDLVLTSLVEFLVTEGVTDGESYEQKMGDQRIHLMLKEKLTGLPYINAITMINPDGKLINFSRYWPIPQVNVSDRDYFQAMRSNPATDRFVSVPVPNRGDGTWTVYLARRVRTADGQFGGLLLGAIELRYFEDLYKTVSPGDESAISLVREDGVLLARYPRTDKIGVTFSEGGQRAARIATGTVREPSPVDGQLRIKSARRLANFPLVVLVTQTESAALRGWSRVAWVLGLSASACAIAVMAAAYAASAWWRQQQRIGEERAERARVETAHARERERIAEEASRSKSGFLAMMSHEIRTPMNAVLGLAGSLLDGKLKPEHQQIVEAIRDSGDNLLRILNDILDYSKLDAGRVTLEDEPFSPEALAHNAVSIMGPRAVAKGLRIEALADTALSVALRGDAGRIRQVLLNLVSNAVKFTERGHVFIAAHQIGTADRQSRVVVEWEISDTGIGIPADKLPTLFDEFMQADSSITRRFDGSGLGLAISKRLAEQMGGSLTVTSEQGRGTTFRLRLTLPVAEMPALPITPPTDPSDAFQETLKAMGRPMRVLFAEDNPTNQFVAVQLLRGFDVHLDLVGDGLEAIDAAERFVYDAICMDVRMPELDGLAATRAIRARGGPRSRIPIIALTANAFHEDVQACFEAGMDQFVSKPVNKATLIAALMRALPGPDVPAAAPAEALADPAAPALDETTLLDLESAIGADAVTQMTDVFIEETEIRLAALANQSALPLLRAVHSLKGSALTAGAAALAARAALVESCLHGGGTCTAADHTEFRTAFTAWKSAMAERRGARTEAE